MVDQWSAGIAGIFGNLGFIRDNDNTEDTHGYKKSDGASSSVDPPLLQQPKTTNFKERKPAKEEDMMAASGGQKKKNPDSIEIPDKWHHYTYHSKDARQLQKDSMKFFAMKVAFKDYRDQIKEFIIALKSDCETVTDSEMKFPLVFTYHDTEDDQYFEEYGKSQNNFVKKHEEALIFYNYAFDRLLQHCIEECIRYKSDIVVLRKELCRLQGERSPHAQDPPAKKDTDLRHQVLPEQRYKDGIDQWKGLQVVKKLLEKQSAILSEANIVGQPSEEEKVAERPELAKLYAVQFEDSIPCTWEYSTESEVLERQLVDKHSTPAQDVVQDEVTRTERDYTHYTTKWKGLTVMVIVLEKLLDGCKNDISMEVTKSIYEECLENEDYVCQIGAQATIMLPSEWCSLKTLQSRKQVIEMVKEHCQTLTDRGRRAIDQLQSLRDVSNEYWHYEWKVNGLHQIMGRLTHDAKYMEKNKVSTVVLEDERSFENEEYVIRCGQSQHSEKMSIQEILKLQHPIRNYEELERVKHPLIEVCTKQMAEIRSLISNMSELRIRIKSEKYEEVLNRLTAVEKEKNEMEKNYKERVNLKLNKQRKEMEDKLEKQKNEMDKKLEKQKKDTEKERKEWGKKDADTIRRLAAKDNDCTRFKEMNTYLQKENLKILKEKESYQKDLQKCQQNLDYFVQELEQKDQQIKGFWHVYEEYKQYSNRLENQNMVTQRKVQELEVEKEKLLTRLSKIASAKLSKGNAAITDLSDPERPMKIAENYSELYDNEWTDALEELLDNGACHDRGIELLMQIVTGAYNFCCEISQKYQERMIESATCLPVQSSVSTGPYLSNQDSNTSETLHTAESADSSQTPDSSQSDESQRPPGRKGIELTEELKQSLDELSKALCPRLLPLVEQHHHIMLEEILMKEFGKRKVSRQNIIEGVESLTQDKTSQSLSCSSPPANLQEVSAEVKVDKQVSNLRFYDKKDNHSDGEGENEDVSGESLRRPKLEEQQQVDELRNQKQSRGESNRGEIQGLQQTDGELDNTLEDDSLSKESFFHENGRKISGMKQPGGAKRIISSKKGNERQSSVNEDDMEKTQDMQQTDITLDENLGNLHHEADSNSVQEDVESMHEYMNAHDDEKNMKESSQETQQNDTEETLGENLSHVHQEADSNSIQKEVGNIHECMNAHDEWKNMKESPKKQETQQNDTEEMEVDIKNKQDKTVEECASVINDGSKTLENRNELPVEDYQHEDMDTDPVNVNSSATYEFSNGKEYLKTPKQNHAINIIDTINDLSPKAEQRSEITAKENEIVKVVLESEFQKTKAFAKKCANLTWFMRIKDPPLHMVYHLDYGSPMDFETFKHYTQSGKLVKFVVWPALFLHKGGPLMAKGVAQPMNKAEAKNHKEKYQDSS